MGRPVVLAWVPLLIASLGLEVAGGERAEPASLVHPSRLVYSAEEKLGFDVEGFLAGRAPWLLPFREAIVDRSMHAAISPKIVLALVELRTGLVSGPPAPRAEIERPFGALAADVGFERQTAAVADRLAHLLDEALRGMGAGGAPGAAATETVAGAGDRALVDLLGSPAELQRLRRTFHQLFPSEEDLSRARPGRAIFAGAEVPPAGLLQLPFPIEEEWGFGGSHSNAGNDGAPRSAIDFSRTTTWPPWGTDTSNDWVVAAHDGTAVVTSSCRVEVLGPDGWSTVYYHLDNIQVATGEAVVADQRLANYADNLAQAICTSGASGGPHVHFSLRRDGWPTSLDGVSLSGYRVHEGRFDYDSDCDHFWLQRNGVRFCVGQLLPNPGLLPAPPSGLVAEALATREVLLRWTDNSDDETGFEIERRSGGGFQRLATVRRDATTAVDATALPGLTYTYRVRARNAAGASAPSNHATATLAGENPPRELRATAVSADAIVLSWIDEGESEAGFEIEMRTEGGGFEPRATVPADTSSAVVTRLEPSTGYTFQVRAIGGLGASTWSAPAHAATWAAEPVPCVAGPSRLCLQGGRFAVEIAWTAPDGTSGAGQVAPASSGDSGVFWFFSQTNWEIVVKVLDGCALNQRFWVLAAALTNVSYTLTVTDSATGLSRTYANPQGSSPPALTDTAAFATCP